MPNKRRCNVCRDYFSADVMVKVGSVWVCSEGCRQGKLTQRPKTPVKPDKKDLREQVKARDGERCLRCGATSGLHLHRVVYGAQGGLYELSNCVWLCGHCHNLDDKYSVHANKRLWQPRLLAYLAGDTNALREIRRLHRSQRESE